MNGTTCQHRHLILQVVANHPISYKCTDCEARFSHALIPYEQAEPVVHFDGASGSNPCKDERKP